MARAKTINPQGVTYDSTRALAERYDVCIETVTAWREKKLIPAGVIVGNTRFFPRDETDQMLMNRE